MEDRLVKKQPRRVGVERGSVTATCGTGFRVPVRYSGHKILAALSGGSVLYQVRSSVSRFSFFFFLNETSWNFDACYSRARLRLLIGINVC